jgi:isoquinoline 1-oxidoreductase
MLYGAVLFPPSFGARFVSMDAAQAQKIPGVVAVVRDEGFVGVVAQRQDIAEQARDMIKATWEETPHPTQATLYDDLRASASPDRTLVDDAIVPAALAGAARTFKQTYRTSFLAHAPIEPHVALVSVTGDGATVWVSAQTPFPHRDAVARALGINTSKVHVFVPRVGGAFGGKENPILAVMAARLSRAVERPVMLGLSRAEELTWDLFKPAALIDVRSGVDAAGKVVAWGADIYNCGPRGAEPPYEFPKHIRTLRCNSPLAQGSWRGLGGSANTLAIECHMDAMASELSVDPVEFRLRHLGDNPRLAKTVQAAADKYGWKPRQAPSGQGIGFACAVDSGSCVAEVVEIDLDRSSGVLRVRRVVAAMESGLIINRDGITNQVQGAITMGLGMVLREAVRYENGKILTDSFAAYGIPTIKDAPLIETVLVDNPIHPPEGAGEPPLFPVAAAAVNAFFDATGERVRQIPLSPETVLAALRA